MNVHIRPSALRETQWREYLVRFGLGGAATAFAGLIAKVYGPAIGGLFLAFPAIFVASATLIEMHERKRMEEAGASGVRRGKMAAGLDASGAALGSLALIVFAGIVWSLSPHLGWWALGIALGGWCVVSVFVWSIRRKLRFHLGKRG